MILFLSLTFCFLGGIINYNSGITYRPQRRGDALMTTEFSLNNTLNLPKEYYSIDTPKRVIALSIKNQIKSKNLSLRKVAANIENFHHPQIMRITRRENYNIDTLLKVLDELDLELKIVPKNER